MSKKIFTLLLVVALLFSLVGCSDASSSVAEEEPQANEEPQAEEILKVAIMVPGSPLDGGWCQFGAEGLKYAAEQLGAQATVVEALDAGVMKTEAEALADDGYSVIIGHGGEYALPFGEVSLEYPDTSFISIGGNICTENQFSLQIATEVAAYIQGVEAAMLSESGVVGTINALEVPSFWKTNVAFELGAKSVNPDIEVLYSVMSNMTDANEAYEIAMSQIANGADVINSNADMAQYGAIKAAAEHGILFSGYGAQFDEYPETILSGINNDLGPAYLTAIELCLSGDVISEPLSAGINEGAVALAYNEALLAEQPAEVQGVYEDILAKVNSGELYVPGENELYEN